MAEPSQDPAEQAEAPDSMDRVTPVRRVDTVGTRMVPIHREPEPPKPTKPERSGISLTLNPFTQRNKSTVMSTMSDLTSQSNPREVKDVAKVRQRHFSAQTTTVRESNDRDAAKQTDKPESK